MSSSSCVAKETLDSHMRLIYSSAIDAVRPGNLVGGALQYDHTSSILTVAGQKYNINRNVFVIGFGKAVLGMAKAVHCILGDQILRGVVSVPVGSLSTANNEQSFRGTPIKVCEGAPGNLPDEAAHKAAIEILQLARDATQQHVVITLVSGGGSALLPLPLETVTLAEKKQVTMAFAKAGATITQLNLLRQCLSQVKGGKLAEACHPAQVVSLILSDVIGDPLHVIASGPTVPSLYTLSDLQSVLNFFHRAGLSKSLPKNLSTKLLHLLESTAQHVSPAVYPHVHNVVIGNNSIATRAGTVVAKQLGYDVITWSHDIEGEARDLGVLFAKIAHLVLRHMKQSNKEQIKECIGALIASHSGLCSGVVSGLMKLSNRLAGLQTNKLCLISGGESTVTVTGSGVGGRNQEMALSFAQEIDKLYVLNSSRQPMDGKLLDKRCSHQVVLGCVGSDGQDGPCDAAGAVVGMGTWTRALEQGLDPLSSLTNNDSYTFFSQFDGGRGQVLTGLTGTNVMDLHIMLLSTQPLYHSVL